MHFSFWRRKTFVFFLQTVVLAHIYGLVAAQLGDECPEFTCGTPSSSFTTKLNEDEGCHRYGKALTVDCETGFQRRGRDEDGFKIVCNRDGTWTWSDSCVIDIFSVFIACIAALVAIAIFFLIMYCIIARKKPSRKNDTEGIVGEPSEVA